MKLLKFAIPNAETEAIETPRMLLRAPEAGDYQQWADLRRASAAFLKPWEPLWTRDELTRTAYRQRLRSQQVQISGGLSLPWFLFCRESRDLLGGLTISNIRRGVTQTGTLGYWMGEAHARKGYMREAVLAVSQSLFKDHGIHRLEAASIAQNTRSVSLLENCGFQFEGTGRKYLKINGRWEDHRLYALLSDDPCPIE